MLLFPQAGVRAARPEHKWVLCLDDDIELHPRSLADLVAAAEADPHVFMATGEAPGHARQLYSILRLVSLAHMRMWSACMGCCKCWRIKLSPLALSSQYGGHQRRRMCSAGTGSCKHAHHVL